MDVIDQFLWMNRGGDSLYMMYVGRVSLLPSRRLPVRDEYAAEHLGKRALLGDDV